MCQPVQQLLGHLWCPIMEDRINVGGANGGGVFAPTYPAFPPGPWYPASVLCYLATTLSNICADDSAARDLALALAIWPTRYFGVDTHPAEEREIVDLDGDDTQDEHMSARELSDSIVLGASRASRRVSRPRRSFPARAQQRVRARRLHPIRRFISQNSRPNLSAMSSTGAPTRTTSVTIGMQHFSGTRRAAAA